METSSPTRERDWRTPFRYLRGWVWPVSLLVGLCVLTFFLSYVAPGDPARIILGPNARPDSVAALRTEMGLDRSMLAQFGSFMREILTGKWGDSWISRQPVLREIGDHLQPTLWLGFFASVYSIALALLLNAFAFVFPRFGKPLIPTLRLGIALPGFVVAVAAALATIRFQGWTGWTADARSGISFLLPAFAVALYPACVMTTLLRDRFRGILASPFYRAARAGGYPLRDLFFRVLLPNSWATLFIAWVNQISLLVFSTIIVEWVFSFRGIGTLLIRSIQGKDLPVLSGIILLNGAFFLLVRTLSREGRSSPGAAEEAPTQPLPAHS
jgi:peptide/nickel transport system permease protein